MSTYPPRARDVDETINAIVGEAAVIALKTGRALRLVGSIDNNRPAALAVSPDPSMPVCLALGDWALLLHLSGDTPMAHQLENATASIDLTPSQYRATALLLEGQSTEWAANVQDHITGQIHPSFLPPADDANPHGIPRPVLV